MLPLSCLVDGLPRGKLGLEPPGENVLELGSRPERIFRPLRNQALVVPSESLGEKADR